MNDDNNKDPAAPGQASNLNQPPTPVQAPLPVAPVQMPSQDPTPLQATQQASYQPASIQDDADAKIGHIKYWGVGILLVVVGATLAQFLSSFVGSLISNLIPGFSPESFH